MENNEEFKVKRRKQIMDDLDKFDDDVVLPSSILSRKESKKKEEEKHPEEYEDTCEWLASVSSFSSPKQTKKIKDIFNNIDGGKKRKKKEKGPKELTDYNKEFEPEITLINGLMRSHKMFTDSLQINLMLWKVLNLLCEGLVSILWILLMP